MRNVSREYAEALFTLAKECGKEELYGKQLNDLVKLFGEQEEYLIFLASPSVDLSERLMAIEKALLGNVEEDVLSFVQLLTEKGRIANFNQCAMEYNELLSNVNKTIKVIVKSAISLSEEKVLQIKEKIELKTGKNVVIEQLVDPSLIGGIIIETEGKIFDGSLKNKLSEIKGVICK